MKSIDCCYGDNMKYISSYAQRPETPCIFIRDDDSKAVVIFQNAEWVARVSYNLLYKCE